LGVAQAWTAGQYNVPMALTSTAGSIAITLANANNFTHLMTENTTLALPTDIATKVGQKGSITFTQDATTAFTLSLASGYIQDGTWPGMSTGLGSVAELQYHVISATQVYVSMSAVLA